jgi:hypothetical protein
MTVSGKTGSGWSVNVNPVGLVLGMLFLAGWFGVGGWSTARDWNIVFHGIHATGTVEHAGFCGGDNDTGALIQYTDRDGHPHQVLSQTCLDGAQPGDRVSFHYAPADPNRIIADGDVGQLRSWTITFVAVSVAALVGLGLLVFFLLRTAVRHRRRAENQYLDTIRSAQDSGLWT